MSFIQPSDRHQLILFSSLDDAIDPDHIVRIIDVLIDQIVGADSDFFLDRGLSPEGRPAYHPSVFLKLYIYGALNGIGSSRKLERECYRNIELMWLLGKLAPDFKTIADYRKDQGDQIEAVFLRVNLFLKSEGLIQGKISSLDGSKFRAYAAKSVNLQKLSDSLEKDKARLAQYLDTLAQADLREDEAQDSDTPPSVPPFPPSSADHPGLGDELLFSAMVECQERIEAASAILETAQQAQNPQKRICTTDPDARIMKGRQGTHWSYNIEASVDAAHGLISDIEPCSDCHDRYQLLPNLYRLSHQMGIEPAVQLTDAGFGTLQQIIELEQGQIEGLPSTTCFIPLAPTPQIIRQEKAGIHFQYDAQQDQYICSEGKPLTLVQKNKRDTKRGTLADQYQAQDCRECPQKPQCSPGSKKARSILRFDNQLQRDLYKQKMKTQMAEQMRRLRMRLSEHPFGTLKQWMGHTPILVRGRQKVSVQIKIFATAFNLLRSQTICSTQKLIDRIQAFDWSALKQTAHLNRAYYLMSN